MQFGVCLHSKIDDIGLVTHAENLGYDAAWFADSQLLWSDAYACLALAAERTRRIRLGTGCSVVDTRLAPVTAHSIASINVLAPGRTFLAVGQRVHGVATDGAQAGPAERVRSLPRHDPADAAGRGGALHVQGRDDRRRVPDGRPRLRQRHRPDPHPRVGLRSEGPAPGRGLRRRSGRRRPAGPSDGRALPGQRGRRRRRRGPLDFDRSTFELTTLTAVGVLEPGEGPDSDRIVEQCGPMAVMALHYAYERQRQFGVEPPVHLRDLWDRYVALIEQTPEDRRLLPHPRRPRHLPASRRAPVRHARADPVDVHGGPARRAGRADPGARGRRVDHVMVLPSFASRYRAMEELATEVFPLSS